MGSRDARDLKGDSKHNGAGAQRAKDDKQFKG